MPQSWPAGLPSAVWGPSYAVQSLGLPLMKSPMQSGRIRQRRQYTLRVATLAYGWRFRPDQLAMFHDFIAGLGDGAGEFTMPVWIATSDAYATRTVQIRDGAAGISEKRVGFNRTLVSCVLDVQNL